MRIQPATPSANPLPFESAMSNDASADPAGFSSMLRQTQNQAQTHAQPEPAPRPQAQSAPPPPPAPVAPPPPASRPGNTHNEAAPPNHESNGTKHAQAPAHAANASKSSKSSSKPAEAAAGEAAETGHAVARSHGRADMATHRFLAGGDKKKEKASEPAGGMATKPAEDARDTAASKTAASPDAALPPYLAAMQMRPDIAKLADAAGDNVKLKPSGDDDLGLATTAGATGRPNEAALASIADPKDIRADNAGIGAGGVDASTAAAMASTLAPLDGGGAEPRNADGASPTSQAIDATGSLLPSAPTDVSTTMASTAEPISASIATPIDSPDFAQVLGMQMSVFTKEGVQKAELHLNPADMGPVSVQIVMDGTQARIEFGADMAATRHAIETGLPELASALRDAGFTLAGGGVSQHSQPRGDGGGNNPSAGRGPGNGNSNGNGNGGRLTSADGVARVASAARRIVNNGGVDLYA